MRKIKVYFGILLAFSSKYATIKTDFQKDHIGNEENMQKDVICLLTTDSLDEAYSLMCSLALRSLPVVEGDRLVGMLSDQDIFKHVLHHHNINQNGITVPANVTVRQVMTPILATCQENTPLNEIAEKMISLKIDAIPITDMNGNLKGIATYTDLLRLVKEWEQPQLMRDLIFEHSNPQVPTQMDIPETVI